MDIIITFFEVLMFGLGIFIIIKIITAPLRLIFKILLNAVLGWVVLFVTNLILSHFGYIIEVNFLTSLIAGVFGMPGVAGLAILTVFSII